ncbi:hypothetical protein EZ242_07395 [Ramlibacter rhizophilus]|uniref:Uncharacterized protein n=1 Tax=Ramlibacter rhizophilus TaxID=1781167 RepID=A0A4Z0BR05_9BURK|nr:hypothetical protein EZ242_07395 [Ramlibacter rhizophilus]
MTFLARLAQRCGQDASSIDVLYLDSFDLDKLYWQPSAIHHLKELTAAMRCLRADTLVVVDDCPSIAECIPAREGDGLMVLNPPAVGGKGLLVAQYAQAVGARLEFAEYQAGWTGMVPSQPSKDHDPPARQSPTRASIAAQ